MRVPNLLTVLGVVALVGCSETIPQLNERPAKYYEKSVSFTGRIARIQEFPSETLLEVADANERRILVRAQGRPDATTGDWITVRGVLVPEARVGGSSVYDVVAAEEIRPVRAPFFRNLF